MLTPDDKYSRRNMQTFWQQVQTPLEHSEKKEEYPILIITEIIASERDVYLRV